ncbi:glycosidase [Microbacterium sp.]|uniref:glycoside hydrolase family 130 protein n=1 Tax=Microbacterium sp. TaxID=51671 RepID=UPI0039E4447A
MTSPAVSTASTVPYEIRRLGVLMSPDPQAPEEVEGVLNPAVATDTDGRVWLFPRLVAEGNFSRIGRAEVQCDGGVPVGVRRDGIALEPDRTWEAGGRHGGAEDPRITRIDALGLYVMTYVAFGPTGPRTALAVSDDARSWRRLGPLQFAYEDALDLDLNLFPNKDVVFFPEIVPAPDGTPSVALLHRPMWDLSFVRPDHDVRLPDGVVEQRPSIWISYVPVDEVHRDQSALTRPRGHRFLAGPKQDWESLKIGAGPAPLRVPEGWLLLYHGVSGTIEGSVFTPQVDVHYAVGAMLLDPTDPSRVIERTAAPLMIPETDGEREGVVANVVFPTAVERIEERDFVFYGMADSRIGVAELVRRES